MARWTEDDIPRLDGKVALITGANGGLGAETTRALAAKGARVILACRSVDKGEAVAQALRTQLADVHPDGVSLEVWPLDLADLDSVAALADRAETTLDALDLLILNAGVMAIPRRETAQGFEMQLGTNHIGHFALTQRLLPLVTAAPAGRVVSVASQAHRMGVVRWQDPMWTRRYDKWLAYGQSKLANLLFAFELDRRLRAEGSPVRSLAAHPGYSDTNLQHVGPSMTGNAAEGWMMGFGNRFLAQSAAMGALPTLRAATDPDAAGGDYYGPDGFFEIQGWPVRVGCATQAADAAAAARFWALSESWVAAHVPQAAAPVDVDSPDETTDETPNETHDVTPDELSADLPDEPHDETPDDMPDDTPVESAPPPPR